MNLVDTYSTIGITGLVAILFGYMILNLMSSQKAQNEDLDGIRVHISKLETITKNLENILLKMLDRWNRSDETSQRHREDIVRELNDVGDEIAYIKGRMNGKS
tara:strand:- start:313 stop:621 length:309 start_codon:yes stop_codon:yes gene_type:complete